MPGICVSVARTRHKMMIAEYKAAAEQGADLVELRLDYLRREPDFGRLLRERPAPVIATCRRRDEGGRFSGSEEDRKRILRLAIAQGVDYVDLEADIADEIPRYGKTKRIISYHNFETTPANLKLVVRHLESLDPDIIKVVTLATSPKDNVRVLELIRETKVPTVAFCMGELGVPSRILCGKWGAPFTYAAFNPQRLLAPGQLTFRQVRDVYHFHQVTRNSEIYAVIGDPIMHSLSPHVHNAAFRHLGIDAIYVPFRVTRDQFPTFLEDVEPLKIRGFSVTIPHKESAVTKVEYADGAVRMVRALNTLVRRDGYWEGHNTDYRAAMMLLESRAAAPAGTRQPFGGKRALVLGAGGVARAIVFGLVRRGALVTVCGRTLERAAALAKEAGARHIPWQQRTGVPCDILVNCTPIGMFPNVDECPVPPGYLEERMLVFDTVYHPENTLLIKEARNRGCQVITGLEMFVKQAVLQFQLFTEQEAPEELMLAVARRELAMTDTTAATAKGQGTSEDAVV